MMRVLFALLCFQLLTAFPQRVAASEVARLLESLSDVVLVGTVIMAPDGYFGSGPIPSTTPVPYWSDSIARIKVDKVLRGELPETPTPLISLRIPMAQTTTSGTSITEAFALFAEGEKLIFFLQDRRLRKEFGSIKSNDESIFLVAFDPYFSALPYNEVLAIAISQRQK